MTVVKFRFGSVLLTSMLLNTIQSSSCVISHVGHPGNPLAAITAARFSRYQSDALSKPQQSNWRESACIKGVLLVRHGKRAYHILDALHCSINVTIKVRIIHIHSVSSEGIIKPILYLFHLYISKGHRNARLAACIAPSFARPLPCPFLPHPLPHPSPPHPLPHPPGSLVPRPHFSPPGDKQEEHTNACIDWSYVASSPWQDQGAVRCKLSLTRVSLNTKATMPATISKTTMISTHRAYYKQRYTEH